MARSGSAIVLTVLAFAIVAAPAGATHYQDMAQVSVHAPPRTYDDLNTLPIEAFERTRPKLRFRVGGHTHRVFWNNSVAGNTSTTEALRAMRRTNSLPTAVFADRRLTAAERRRFREAAPLYDDADVMVVAAGHPACDGVTRAQARAIVAGKITRWSQLVTGATSDTIKVRYRGSASRADLRFGARYVRRPSGRYKVNYPAGSRGSSDAGVSAAASGDQSIAGVMAWSRFRRQPGVCAVPLNGVTPSNASVIDHSYPEAYRVTYVVSRRRVGALNRVIARVVEDFMRSEATKSFLAARGLLVVGGAPASNPGSGGGTTQPDVAAPTTDHAGRPITTTSDSSAEQTLIGERIDSPMTADGWHRFAFDANGTLRRFTFDASGTCVRESGGGWTVKGAWRYSEYGGGLIAKVGWFIGDPQDERVIDLPDAEPQTAYLDGTPYKRDRGAAATCSA